LYVTTSFQATVARAAPGGTMLTTAAALTGSTCASGIGGRSRTSAQAKGATAHECGSGGDTKGRYSPSLLYGTQDSRGTEQHNRLPMGQPLRRGRQRLRRPRTEAPIVVERVRNGQQPWRQ